ncbi:MAG TPA: ABC transporter ATP-binding protein [Gaiellaceae bacterium]|nr:ABC transporter ATP-binding protein [Gaiellaceae bacterium]
MLLAARGVTRRFRDHVALHPTDLEVQVGDAVALVGPNGAGKSTLLALLAGSLPPSGGSVERAPGATVGWAPQRAGHYGRLTSRENLELFARLAGERDPPVRATALLDTLGLRDDARPSGVLSVGQRQRLNLALALLGDPDLLLADEPTAALDEHARERFWELAAARRAAGGAVVFATQAGDEPARYATRVLSLEEGRLA